jgi:hypothetical protein
VAAHTKSELDHRSGPRRSGLLLGLVAIFLSTVAAFTAPSSPVSAADPIKILPIGDSLTQGITDTRGEGLPPPSSRPVTAPGSSLGFSQAGPRSTSSAGNRPGPPFSQTQTTKG